MENDFEKMPGSIGYEGLMQKLEIGHVEMVEGPSSLTPLSAVTALPGRIVEVTRRDYNSVKGGIYTPGIKVDARGNGYRSRIVTDGNTGATIVELEKVKPDGSIERSVFPPPYVPNLPADQNHRLDQVGASAFTLLPGHTKGTWLVPVCSHVNHTKNAQGEHTRRTTIEFHIVVDDVVELNAQGQLEMKEDGPNAFIPGPSGGGVPSVTEAEFMTWIAKFFGTPAGQTFTEALSGRKPGEQGYSIRQGIEDKVKDAVWELNDKDNYGKPEHPLSTKYQDATFTRDMERLFTGLVKHLAGGNPPHIPYGSALFDAHMKKLINEVLDARGK
ncbi:MAG TPA: hypothetical protein VGE45_00470 [Chloroflexia bacterium]|jgi:hypothetical protein